MRTAALLLLVACGRDPPADCVTEQGTALIGSDDCSGLSLALNTIRSSAAFYGYPWKRFPGFVSIATTQGAGIGGWVGVHDTYGLGAVVYNTDWLNSNTNALCHESAHMQGIEEGDASHQWMVTVCERSASIGLMQRRIAEAE